MVLYYECVLTEAELFADTFDLIDCFDGICYKIKSDMMTKKGLEFDNGGDEDLNEGDEQVNNVVNAFYYQACELNKKDFATTIKIYMKKLLAYLSENKPERVEEFKKGAQKVVKFILENFKLFEFYHDRDMKDGAMPIMAYWEDEANDVAPTFIYFKDGAKAVKY